MCVEGRRQRASTLVGCAHPPTRRHIVLGSTAMTSNVIGTPGINGGCETYPGFP
jgi:hypothetical protein